MRVSYLEIYNEEVRDLLGKDQNSRLEVRCCHKTKSSIDRNSLYELGAGGSISGIRHAGEWGAVV